MKIDENLLLKVEKLAKIQLDDKQRQKAIGKIAGVLDILDKIDMDEIADLKPLYHPLEIQQVMRDDVCDADIDRAALQAGSPLVEKGLFLVPKVIE